MDLVPHHPHRNAVPIPYPGPPSPAYSSGMGRFSAMLRRMNVVGNPRPRLPNVRFPPPTAFIVGRKRA